MIDLPIAVLIDDQSISAAEFFAAALQEYERATLVGTHTTGKGRAQRTYQLSDGSAVNLSVEEYFTPKGKSLADVGIAPDIEVKLTDEQTQNFFKKRWKLWDNRALRQKIGQKMVESLDMALVLNL